MKRFLKSSVATAFVFALSIMLLSVGTIGGTRAALQRESNIYQSQISMRNIGVTLIENGHDVSYRNYDTTYANGQWDIGEGYLIQNMVKDAGDSALKIGKTYPFALSIRNSGSIDQYLRVTIYKYFVDASGNKISADEYGWFNGVGTKQVNIDPSKPYPESTDGRALIDIELANTNVWIEDTEASTPERTVLYYQGNNGILKWDEDSTTIPFTTSFTVSSDITKLFTNTTDDNGNGTSNYIYSLEGLGVVVEVTVDAVQTRHADEAKTSAWGLIR